MSEAEVNWFDRLEYMTPEQVIAEMLADLTVLRRANTELSKELEAARAQIEHLSRGLNASLGWNNPIIKQGA